MIVADSFLWLHLPKTGGTSMNRLFLDRAIPNIAVDPDDVPAKHDSVPLREGRGDWRAGGRRRFITARRLTDWLVSDWQHKRRHMGLPDLDFAPVRSGLSYSLRLGAPGWPPTGGCSTSRWMRGSQPCGSNTWPRI